MDVTKALCLSVALLLGKAPNAGNIYSCTKVVELIKQESDTVFIRYKLQWITKKKKKKKLK